ncbi:MAG TPA: hypothetical protein VIX80_07180 [Candidatus Kapabacteria bacterium]
MKKVLLAFVFCALAFVSVRSQTTELEIIKSKYKVEKKELVAGFMKFSEEEATRFWPLYEEYEAERTKLGNKRVELLKKYASQYQTITDDQVDELISEIFDLHEDIISLREKYYGKVKEKLNARRAAGFVQIEEFLENIIRLTIQANIPFFGDLEKK